MQHGKFVLDSNFYMNHSDELDKFEHIYLPLVILEEIDHLKISDSDIKSFKARQASRAIKKAKNIEKILNLSSFSGMSGIDLNKNDNIILQVAKSLSVVHEDLVLITDDLNMVFKAESLKIPCVQWDDNTSEALYTGIKYIELKDEDECIDDILESIDLSELVENQYVLLGFWEMNLKYNQKQFQTVKAYRWSNGLFEDVQTPRLGEKLNDCFRDNAEQALVYDAMNCDFIDIIAITGCAGTGKNYVALANALFQVNKPSKNKKGAYKSKHIAYTRNLTEISNEKVGYLPGELSSKISPFMSPSRINLQKILDLIFGEGQEDVDKLIEDKKYQEMPISFLRGVTLDDSFMIYDECANASKDDLKTFISRAGSSSKVILIGSFNQIDKKGNTSTNNGLYEVIKRYKGQKNFACIELNNQERSFLSCQADELLK